MGDASTVQDSAAKYQNRRHCRAVVIFVTAMGLLGVAVAIVLATVYGSAFTEAKPSARQLEGFTLDEVLTGKFYAESFNGTWISGLFFFSRSLGTFYLIRIIFIFASFHQITNSPTEPPSTESIFTMLKPQLQLFWFDPKLL